MSTPAIQGPVPPYSNVNIHAEYYLPNVFVISNISLGVTTTVTTINNLNYTIGQTVRLIIPPANGCRQLNGVSGNVLSLPAPNQVQIDINSFQNVDPFISVSNPRENPQILAIGDINNGFINSNGPKQQTTFVQGSFINVSP